MNFNPLQAANALLQRFRHAPDPCPPPATDAQLDTAVQQLRPYQQPNAVPTLNQEPSMSNPFTEIITGLSKAESFLVNVFTHTSDVDAIFTKLAPATKAAILSIAYDGLKTIDAASADVAAFAAGNVPAAITLSVQTVALAKTVVTDAKTAGSVIENDLKQIGVAIKAAV